MMHRRGGTPLGNGPPSLEASNQGQINDLVQRNRTLEHKVKKLSEQLTIEESRAKKAVADIRDEWKLKELEWREGCDTLQACYNIVLLRNNLELEKERMVVLKEMEVIRKERIKTLQRDFRITMFRAKEAELESRITELEEEQEMASGVHEENAIMLKESQESHTVQLRDKDKKLEVVEGEKADLEERLATLRAEHAHLQASTGASSSKLERTILQLEGAQTRIADLERTNNEIKRTGGDLQRQLKKWETLEKKGDTELESLRKRRIELEVQNKELQERLDRMVSEDGNVLEKEKRKVEKYKEVLEQWKAKVEELQETEEDSSKQLNKAQKQIERLKAQLESERARIRPPSPEKRRAHPRADNSEDEVATEIGNAEHSPPPKTKPPIAKIKLKSAQGTSLDVGKDRESGSEAGPSGAQSRDVNDHPKASRTKKTTVKTADGDLEEMIPQHKAKAKEKSSRPEEVPRTEQLSRDKGKGKAKAMGPDENVQIIEPKGPLPKTRPKRKTPPDVGNSDIEIVVNQPIPNKTQRIAGKPASVARGTTTKPKRGRPPSRANSLHPEQGEESGASGTEKDVVPKKKKRKINIFPTNNAEPPGINFMPQGDNSLNIPTVLSPVKESEGIPTRSTSGSVIGNIGSMLINSFSRRGA
ncbi:hypothetical protein BDZ94DRAFT_1318186 [Collybia nuda]|uniref:Uncharacterized protein n=1 Tax=Collybia nuda TaxID=64659 RepID=A0A9P6CPY1_9AGAR|nr:hypothetical protein BDZ94DRAFT_1318186 [Collybia nuda]